MPGFTGCCCFVVAGVLASALLSTPAAAQSWAVGHAALGPTIGADDLHTFALNVVGGGERREGRLGVGGDFAVLFFPAAVRAIGVGEVSGSAFWMPLASAFGAYHFGQTGRGLEPFAQAGFAVSFAGGWAWEFAGGADWWLTPRVGVRTAVRERVAGLPPGLLGLDGGIAFR